MSYYSEHKEARRKYAIARRRECKEAIEAHIAQGLCGYSINCMIRCTDHKRLCNSHYDKKYALDQRRRKSLISRKLCVKCQGPSPEGTRVCKTCAPTRKEIVATAILLEELRRKIERLQAENKRLRAQKNRKPLDKLSR